MSSEENLSSPQGQGTAAESESESDTSSNPPPSAPSEIVNLFESMETLSAVAQGQIVRATVVKITETDVLVDLGLKSEGAIPHSEFVGEDGQLTVKPGEVVDVWIEQYDEHEGTVTVSRRKAAHRKLWEDIEQAFQEQTTVRGRVVERIKGGLTVDIGVGAFLPGSQADLRPHFNVDLLVGQEIGCKIIKLNRKRNNVVVSRKLALEEEATHRKAELLEKLQEGAELVGRVKNLTDYGAFVDLGGMDGLLHITDLAWGRVRHPSEVVEVGKEIRVKVLKYDREKGRVSLGLKQLTPDPWERVAATYHAGDRLAGRVVSLVDYGAFIELEPGVEGLIHVSEMSWSRRLKHPAKILKQGDRVEVVLLDVNPTQRRISLSLRQTLPDPWADLSERYAVGTVVHGKVRNLTDFGVFVEIQEGVDGLIHLSDLSWTKKVKHPSEVLEKGQTVDAVVLSLDLAQRRLSLGLKQLEPNIWEDFFAHTQVGEIIRGKVSRLASFGAFVELREGIEGLCHVSEFDEDHSEGGKGRPEVGKEYDFRVIRLSPTEKKIGLSMRESDRETPVAKPAVAEKLPERMSSMAEALSLAGITTTPEEQPSSPAAKVES